MQGDLQCISFFVDNPKKFAIHFIFAVKPKSVIRPFNV